MKKKIFYFLAFVLLLFIAFKAYVGYKKSVSLDNVLHKDAHQVIKVNTYEIGKTLLFDYLSNSNYYEQHKDSVTSIQKEDNLKGVSMPFAVVIQTIKNIPDTYFTVLKLTDVGAFEKSLTNQIGEDLNIKHHKEDYKSVYIEKFKTSIAWLNEQLVIVYGNSQSKKVKDIQKDLLFENNIIDENSKLFQDVVQSYSHVSYRESDSETTFSITFDNQKISISGPIEIAGWQHKNEPFTASRSGGEVLFLAGDFGNNDLSGWISKLDFVKNMNIDSKVLSQNLTGYMDIAIYDEKTTQKDTVISYVYNDDFEKIEEKQIQEKEVPVITSSFRIKDSTLLKYLYKNKHIQSEVFTSFPLYQLTPTLEDNRLIFSNADTITLERPSPNSVFFMSLYADTQKIKAMEFLPFSNRIPEKLESINAVMTDHGIHTVWLDCSINFSDKNVNALAQLFTKQKEE